MTSQSGRKEASATDAARSFLTVNNIEVIYDHVILVLKGVSLQVPEGGIVALLGANGAGKTTTLKAISNLLRAERGEVTKGSIEYMGERVGRLSPNEVVRRGVLPTLAVPQALATAILQARGSDALTLVLSTHEGTMHTVAQLVEMVRAKGLARVNLFIGPEGGYSAEELQQFDDAGIESLSLGPRKVRSETAAIAVTSIIASLL